MKIIAASIDLTKIDKSRIKTKDKNGVPFKNGQQYYDIIINLNDVNDQYGNIAMITEGLTKEERAEKKKGTILGNGKTIWSNDGQEKPQAEVVKDQQAKNSSSLPF